MSSKIHRRAVTFDYIEYKDHRVISLTLYCKAGIIQASTVRDRVGTTMPQDLNHS